MWVIVEDEGKRLRVAVVNTPEGVWVAHGGMSFCVPRGGQLAPESRSNDAVVAPMTAKVVSVHVEVTQVVPADALLVILEAMKMEYRLTAPRGGVVASVACKPGDLVDLGATLVAFEHDQSG